MKMRSPSILTPAFLVLGLTLGSWTWQAMAFTDVPLNANYKASVDALVEVGAVNGYSNDTFRPDQLVNRAEFLKVLTLTAFEEDIPAATAGCFTDQHANEWYWSYACFAKVKGIVSGNPDGSFSGERTVNLAEALKMTTLAFDVTLPVYIRAPDHWYDPYLDAAASFTIYAKVPREPSRAITRKDMAIIIADIAESKGMLGDSEGKKCLSSDSCNANEYCTTEDGACESACPPDAENCIMVCAGTCKAKSMAGGSCTAKKEDIDALLGKKYSCTKDSDCAMVQQGCPLVTCGAAVSVGAQASVQSTIDAYAESCAPNACAKCLAQEPACEKNVCVLRPL